MGSVAPPAADTTLAQAAIAEFTATDPQTSTFQIDPEGKLSEVPAAPIAPSFERSEGPRPLDPATAHDHHLFLVGADVDPEELEALAVSVWDDAGWLSAGILRLTTDARLEGPWQVDADVRRQLGTPSEYTQAWVLHCPVERGRAPIPGRGVSDRWTEAFPGGAVRGFEYRTLLNLEHMARRLAGGLRIAGSGALIAPDPDSAVDLLVCAPRWVGPEDLLLALRAEFPQMVDSRDIPTEDPGQPHARQVQRIAAIRENLGDVPEQVRRNIEQARQDAMTAPPVVDSYALVGPAANRSRIIIEVEPLARVPRALRWEEWARSAAFSYRLHWMPEGSTVVPARITSRAMRLERLRVAHDIEVAAGIVHAVVGGRVVDEDGFLVGLADPEQ